MIIRSGDGNIKAVYKHKIKTPLFFLILVLILILVLGGSLFFLQNKSYLEKRVRLQEPDFDIDQILLKVLIRSNEFIEKQIRVMNTGSELIAIKVDANNLADIVKSDSTTFSLKPGQTKIVTLNFSSFLPEQKIEQQPGTYVGKLVVSSQKASIEIPIVVEIETKNVLFDMNLNPVAIERKIKQGSDTTIEVRLFNLESIGGVNVDVEYFVKDVNNNTILTESETVVVKTQASFFKTIPIPKNLKPGAYVFAALAKFGSSVGTSSYLFEVIVPEEENFIRFCKNSILCLGFSLTTILLLFALMAYLYFFIGAYSYDFERIKKTLKPSNKLKKFYMVLNESNLDEAYIKARDLYVDLPNQEKQEVYGKLVSLYKQRDKLIEKSKRQEELEKQRQEKIKAQKLGQIKQLEERLRKNKENAEQLQTELRKLESETNLLLKGISEIEYRKQIEEFGKKQEVEKNTREVQRIKLRLEALAKERGQLNAELSKLKSELHGFSFSFFKSLISGYKEKIQKIRKESEEGALVEAVKKRSEEEIRKHEENLKKEQEKKGTIEKKAGWFKRLFKKEVPLHEKIKEHEEKPKEGLKTKEKKPSIFADLFVKIKKVEEIKKEEFIPEKKRQRSEVEELEEAIKSLGLFKKIETQRATKEKRTEEIKASEK